MYSGYRTQRGFTLIEMMVAVTIFSMVLLMGVGSILVIVDANRKAQSLKSAMNNLNFTLETISRNVRVGTNYHCAQNIPNGVAAGNPRDCTGEPELALESQYGSPSTVNDQLIYSWDEGDQAIYRQTLGPSGPRVRLTAEEVKITAMTFYVDGAQSSSDGVQPRVLMRIAGYAEVGGIRSDFHMQTGITQRILDL